ncbi:hypothetical protein V6N11_017087 [Hibiscus sabdariffa]|uniref:Uncharacterized protein n=1 Tax=Hibiscus sabdariffa TaxID=183260 RepID=A0ABR2TXM7_9ROSI
MDASKEKEEALALAQQTSERETNLWWDTPPDQINPQDLEDHDSHYAELPNGLYRTRNHVYPSTLFGNICVIANIDAVEDVMFICD